MVLNLVEHHERADFVILRQLVNFAWRHLLADVFGDVRCGRKKFGGKGAGGALLSSMRVGYQPAAPPVIAEMS